MFTIVAAWCDDNAKLDGTLQPMTTAFPTESLISPESLTILLSAHQSYHAVRPPSYDEVLTEIAERVREAESIGKADIGALLFWKRLRADTIWARALLELPEAKVRELTAPAVEGVNDLSLSVREAAVAGRKALSALPGFGSGDALASALLVAAAPHRMAIYDRRAQKGLKVIGVKLSPARGRYGRYMEQVEAIRATAKAQNHEWTARDVDLALYTLGA
ncbi:hypothetical protein [Paenarthrobacter sp. NPDC089316]|uniref:hypothetical protein n=1 Tax=unclassified Paenarthrobacter TaxID=2634190 RepID=UPI0034209846